METPFPSRHRRLPRTIRLSVRGDSARRVAHMNSTTSTRRGRGCAAGSAARGCADGNRGGGSGRLSGSGGGAPVPAAATRAQHSSSNKASIIEMEWHGYARAQARPARLQRQAGATGGCRGAATAASAKPAQGPVSDAAGQAADRGRRANMGIATLLWKWKKRKRGASLGASARAAKPRRRAAKKKPHLGCGSLLPRNLQSFLFNPVCRRQWPRPAPTGPRPASATCQGARRA